VLYTVIVTRVELYAPVRSKFNNSFETNSGTNCGVYKIINNHIITSYICRSIGLIVYKDQLNIGV